MYAIFLMVLVTGVLNEKIIYQESGRENEINQYRGQPGLVANLASKSN